MMNSDFPVLHISFASACLLEFTHYMLTIENSGG